MKTLLTSYIILCLVCPVFNYTEQVPEQDTVHEVLFWCDCGTEMHWKDMMIGKT